MDFRPVTRLPSPQLDWAFFLDVDGTLVEIAASPEAVRVAPDLVQTLGMLHRLNGGAVALLSGRRIADLDRLFHPLVLPAAGVHGLERRGAGAIVESVAPTAAVAALGELCGALTAFAAQHPGLRVEDKGISLALHYRLAPRFERVVRTFMEKLAAPYGTAFRLLHGKMVIELQPQASDKGRAISAFMAEPPFRGRIPLFAGDDVTDEDGFRAVNALNGISLRVGDARPSAARWHLPSVAAMHGWLGQALATAKDTGRNGASLVSVEEDGRDMLQQRDELG
jgi:trehalose 6-phosphate phosphatase